MSKPLSDEDKFWQSIRAPRWKGKQIDVTLSEVDETGFQDEVMVGLMVNISETGIGLRTRNLPKGMAESDVAGKRYLLEFQLQGYGLSSQFLRVIRVEESKDERFPFYVGAKFEKRIRLEGFLDRILKGTF